MEFISREITSANWTTILVLLSMTLLAAAKLLNSGKFSDFTMLFSNNKYIVMYQKTNKISAPFNALLLCFQCITVSLFIYVCYQAFGWGKSSDHLILYLKVLTVYTMVVICKILIEKIIATIFSIDNIIDSYLFYKVSYRNFLGLILLPISIIFIYAITPKKITLIILIFILLTLNIIVLLSIYKKNETIILNNLLYFILYLCALEIVPYFILYKLIK